MQADAIHQLGEEIGIKLANSETLGADGKVDESMKLLEEVEELKKRKALAEVNLTVDEVYKCLLLTIWSEPHRFKPGYGNIREPSSAC